jgi:hypothetical protein
MDQDSKTSFIPKRPVAAQARPSFSASPSSAPIGPTPARKAKGGGLFMLIAVVVFVAALLAAGGVYAYKSYLSSNIMQLQDSLDRARDVFEPETISALQLLDKRIDAAESVLSKHIAVSPIFDLLAEITYPNIQYTEFAYSINEATGEVFVEMAGRSAGFDWVGVQADKFDESPHIKNPIFSNLVQDQFGRITFDLTFSVDKPFVTYGSPLNNTVTNN